MPGQIINSKKHTPISEIEIDKLVFTQKPSNVTNYEFAKNRGFLFVSPNTNKDSKHNTISKEAIKSKNEYLKQRFDCETWRNSKMRDRMHRLKIYSIVQETYINRDGEEGIRVRYPAFTSHEMKEVLNKQHKRYEETGDPACLHDWKCSISNGCSEEELRETIMDLHVAEQNYPEQKKRKSRVYYITDNEGFTTKVINRRNNKNGQRVRRQMPQVTTKNVTDISEM
jgi:hypothetical protein